MLPSAIYQMPNAFANPAANSGIYILQHHATSVLREVLYWVIQVRFIIHESDHHP